jgi:GNAT superfamily N-acetyltransferase
MSPSSRILADRPTESALLLARCHENSIEAYRLFARTTPRGRIEEHNGLVLIDCCATDSMGNVAVVTAAPRESRRVIEEAAAFFAANGSPWLLLVLPEAATALEGAARDAGLRYEGRFPGLLLDPIPEQIPPPPKGVKVHRVDTVEELQVFERTASRAYEVESGPVYREWLTYPGFSFHLAYCRDEPVATATLVASHGVAGIVYVGTVPEARRRGFGRAAVWAAIEEGRRQGLRTSALWATPMGRAMYERMGFRPITEYLIWTPIDSPLPGAFRPS